MQHSQENNFIAIVSGSLFSMYEYATAIVNTEISHVFIVGIVGGAGGYFGKFLIHKTVEFCKNNK